MKKIIDVCMNNGVGIIISYKSGVFFTNQTGGLACHHPIYEGIYTPLDLDNPISFFNDIHLADIFDAYTTKDFIITLDDADKLDIIFSKHPNMKRFIVDRSKLKESEEAWIYVIMKHDNYQYADIQGFKECKAVIIYENSD